MSGLLRICTAGSVDDGKSTLIGRLLYDSRSVYEDQVHSVEKASKNRIAGPIDFSLFTDGLKAEREQGITIDVAYRYFATARRKFILADTPGHEQYTRNMATGASTADLAILLVDARHGVRVQSRRHAQIARLLGITDYVLAVNKMDLVDFERGVFEDICEEFDRILPNAKLHAIPMSALHGDNVITRSDRTPWFDGASLLEYLETIEVDRNATAKPFRMPVQLVLRPNHEFRGYAGQIVSGTVRPGDVVTVVAVGAIVEGQGDRDVGWAPRRGPLADVGDADARRRDRHQPRRPAGHRRSPRSAGSSRPSSCGWTSGRWIPSRVYVLKHTTRVSTAEVDHALVLNQIGSVTLSTARPLIFDRYAENRGTGSFILIDPATQLHGRSRDDRRGRAPAHGGTARPSAAERLARLARGAGSDAEAVEAVRKALEELLT